MIDCIDRFYFLGHIKLEGVLRQSCSRSPNAISYVYALAPKAWTKLPSQRFIKRKWKFFEEDPRKASVNPRMVCSYCGSAKEKSQRLFSTCRFTVEM